MPGTSFGAGEKYGGGATVTRDTKVLRGVLGIKVLLAHDLIWPVCLGQEAIEDSRGELASKTSLASANTPAHLFAPTGHRLHSNVGTHDSQACCLLWPAQPAEFEPTEQHGFSGWEAFE